VTGAVWLAHVSHRIDASPDRPARALLTELTEADPDQAGYTLAEGRGAVTRLVGTIAQMEGFSGQASQGLLILVRGVAITRVQRAELPNLDVLLLALDSLSVPELVTS
jgi:hypothetical protein